MQTSCSTLFAPRKSANGDQHQVPGKHQIASIIVLEISETRVIPERLLGLAAGHRSRL